MPAFSIKTGTLTREKLGEIMGKLQELSGEGGVEFSNFKIFSHHEGGTNLKLDEEKTDEFNKTFAKTDALPDEQLSPQPLPNKKPTQAPMESKGEGKRKLEAEPEPQSRTKSLKEENKVATI